MNQQYKTPRGMSRRHFMKHLSAGAAMAAPALCFTNSLRAQADKLKANNKAAILLWMGGGPATIDICIPVMSRIPTFSTPATARWCHMS